MQHETCAWSTDEPICPQDMSFASFKSIVFHYNAKINTFF